MNILSEHINAVNRTKNYQSTLILLCFSQYLHKKVGTRPELSTILKILLLDASQSGVEGWPSIWYNSSNTQIRALDRLLQFLNFLTKSIKSSLFCTKCLLLHWILYSARYVFHDLRNIFKNNYGQELQQLVR